MSGLAPSVTTPRSTALLTTRRLAQLVAGLVVFGLGVALMVRAGVGLPPWDVLAQGVHLRTGIPFGVVVVAVSVVVMLLWIPIRERPGLGTVLNALMIGPSAELGLRFIPQQTEPWQQAIVFAGGLALVGIATGLYIGARYGPGPRDGLMTGLHRRTGRPIWMVRTALEVTVLAIGWVLGGQVGIGTVAFALLIGPMANITLPLFDVKPRMAEPPAARPGEA